VELNGALSNPCVEVELQKLGNLREKLLELAASDPRLPRAIPPRALPVSDTIAAVLQLVGRPMTIPEIRAATKRFLGEPLSAKQIKAALSSGTFGRNPRFKRTRRGVYQAKSPHFSR
jgi:hypothetical protein